MKRPRCGRCGEQVTRKRAVRLEGRVVCAPVCRRVAKARARRALALVRAGVKPDGATTTAGAVRVLLPLMGQNKLTNASSAATRVRARENT